MQLRPSALLGLDRRRMVPDWLILLLVLVGCGAAAINLVAAARVALYGTSLYQPSIDFQWSPARLLLHHVDPWHEQLIGNPSGALILGQQPNYLHFIYIFFVPFGALSFLHARTLWLICNLCFTVAGFIRVARYYQLNRLQTAVAAIYLLASVSLGVALSNGQQTLLVFLFFTLALCRTAPPDPLWTGFAYFKYSFGPPLFFLVLFRKGWASGLRGVAISLLPFALGFLLIRAWLHTPTLTLLLEPLRVSTTVVGPGFEDLMTVLLALHAPGPIAYLLPVLACGGAVWLISRPAAGYTDRTVVAAISLMGALFFKHLGYDNVLMIFPASFALRHYRSRAARIALACVLYFWFGVRIVHRFVPAYGDHLLAVNFVLATLLLLATLRIEPRSAPAASTVFTPSDRVHVSS